MLVHTRLAVEIPPHASYIFHKYDLAHSSSEYYLSLSYVDLTTVLQFVQQLHGLYRLSPSAKPLALAELIRAREEAIPFESSAIQDIRERVLLPNGEAILAQQVQPLLLCPGRFQLTDARIYFQNFNTVSSEATSRIDISEIKRIYKRRYVMRDTALEVFLPVKSGFGSSQSSSSSSSAASSILTQTSVYFNFPTKQLRDTVYSLITSSERFAPVTDQSLTSMTASWIKGETSTFEYLLCLNACAGRSWMDLTQYPVMPWVLQDYSSPTLDLNDPRVYRDLSKPVGALNPERLEMFRRRMREMPVEISHGHPFLYGTHYSSPGYVLYYLVRKAPQYMLRLQAGKFDQPDRLFHSIQSTWKSVLEAPTDVKELIPEFYADPATMGSDVADFLLNTQELDLGVRQTGQPVEDVTLPPWAHSAADFLSKMRQALESDYVSQHLHEWIDLIFGYKQKGEEAIKADNLFYYLTYEGAVDLDTIADPQQRRSFELQINEFGQTPKQLFAKPHPKRYDLTGQIEPVFETTLTPLVLGPDDYTIPPSVGSEQPDLRRLQTSEPLPISPPARKSGVFVSSPLSPSTGSTTLPLNQSLDSIVQPSSLLSTSARDLAMLDQGARALQLAAEVSQIQTKQLNVDDEWTRTLANNATSSSTSSAASSASVTAPCTSSHGEPQWSHLIDGGWTKRDTLTLHRDTITSVQFADNNLVSVSGDGHVKVYSVDGNKLIRSSKISDMTLSACRVSPDGKSVYIASWCNHVFLYNQSFGRVVTSVQAHDDAVSCLSRVRNDRILTGSWDTTVKMFQTSESTISERPIAEFAEHEAAITAVDMNSTGTIGASGSEDGALILWDLRSRDGRQIEVRQH